MFKVTPIPRSGRRERGIGGHRTRCFITIGGGGVAKVLRPKRTLAVFVLFGISFGRLVSRVVLG